MARSRPSQMGELARPTTTARRSTRCRARASWVSASPGNAALYVSVTVSPSFAFFHSDSYHQISHEFSFTLAIAKASASSHNGTQKTDIQAHMSVRKRIYTENARQRMSTLHRLRKQTIQDAHLLGQCFDDYAAILGHIRNLVHFDELNLMLLGLSLPPAIDTQALAFSVRTHNTVPRHMLQLSKAHRPREKSQAYNPRHNPAGRLIPCICSNRMSKRGVQIILWQGLDRT
jgi:hypothetical protein